MPPPSPPIMNEKTIKISPLGPINDSSGLGMIVSTIFLEHIHDLGLPYFFFTLSTVESFFFEMERQGSGFTLVPFNHMQKKKPSTKLVHGYLKKSMAAKGQLISELNLGIIKSPKKLSYQLSNKIKCLHFIFFI